MTIDSVKNMKEALREKLKLSFGSTVEEASDEQMLRASALVLRDVMAERGVDSARRSREEHKRKVHYLSMEFLMGRSLMKNAFNLGVGEILTEALDELGFRAADIFECEPDAGLGNGGLGRLAACYLDSMTTLDIPAAGYSICYELGIFRQRIVDGQQVELPDNWKDLGGADAEIVVIGREAGSGTRDGFESITSTKEACKYRQELTSTGDVITTVANNPNAIGYASLAALQDSVKALTVGGVAPSEATVKDGSYVIQRPFVLVTKTGTQFSEVAQKFFDFATSAEANDLISKAGAVPVK